jgi:hypothetical protein
MKLATLPQKNVEKSAPEPAKGASGVKTSGSKARSSPPRYLSRQMKNFWKLTFERRDLQPHEEAIFLEACRSFERAEQARKVLLRKGLTYDDRFGQPRPRPEIAVERESRLVFAKLIKHLNLDERWSWE